MLSNGVDRVWGSVGGSTAGQWLRRKEREGGPPWNAGEIGERVKDRAALIALIEKTATTGIVGEVTAVARSRGRPPPAERRVVRRGEIGVAREGG